MGSRSVGSSLSPRHSEEPALGRIVCTVVESGDDDESGLGHDELLSLSFMRDRSRSLSVVNLATPNMANVHSSREPQRLHSLQDTQERDRDRDRERKRERPKKRKHKKSKKGSAENTKASSHGHGHAHGHAQQESGDTDLLGQPYLHNFPSSDTNGSLMIRIRKPSPLKSRSGTGTGGRKTPIIRRKRKKGKGKDKPRMDTPVSTSGKRRKHRKGKHHRHSHSHKKQKQKQKQKRKRDRRDSHSTSTSGSRRSKSKGKSRRQSNTQRMRFKPPLSTLCEESMDSLHSHSHSIRAPASCSVSESEETAHKRSMDSAEMAYREYIGAEYGLETEGSSSSVEVDDSADDTSYYHNDRDSDTDSDNDTDTDTDTESETSVETDMEMAMQMDLAGQEDRFVYTLDFEEDFGRDSYRLQTGKGNGKGKEAEADGAERDEWQMALQKAYERGFANGYSMGVRFSSNGTRSVTTAGRGHRLLSK